MKHNSIVPDAASKLSKKEQVADMFNNIAGKYDFLNHTLSLGIDKTWRKKAIKALMDIHPQQILDVASGTGDLAITAARMIPTSKIVGIDIAQQMLQVGEVKIKELELQSQITMALGDSEQLNFPDLHFDAVMCAYGTRNFQDLKKGLKEMARVTRVGGKVSILEFSKPKAFPIKQVYAFYFKYMLPLFGKLVSKHNQAYTYLPESVMAFPEGAEFCAIMEECGFKNVKAMPLTLGITSLYTAVKE